MSRFGFVQNTDSFRTEIKTKTITFIFIEINIHFRQKIEMLPLQLAEISLSWLNYKKKKNAKTEQKT